MSSESQWQTVELLVEPTRRALFAACRAARRPQTRDELATAVGVSRRLAAFHLDILADAGLLTVDYARPAGRTGPGAGRPAKRYAVSAIDVDVSLPARRYDVAARIMARGIAATSAGADARSATVAAAHEEGASIGAARRPRGRLSAARTIDLAVDVLSDLGYEPRCDNTGCVSLANCPFDAAVAEASEVVCGLNLGFVDGILAGLDGHRSVRARLDPAADRCCVVVNRK